MLDTEKYWLKVFDLVGEVKEIRHVFAKSGGVTSKGLRKIMGFNITLTSGYDAMQCIHVLNDAIVDDFRLAVDLSQGGLNEKREKDAVKLSQMFVDPAQTSEQTTVIFVGGDYQAFLIRQLSFLPENFFSPSFMSTPSRQVETAPPLSTPGYNERSSLLPAPKIPPIGAPVMPPPVARPPPNHWEVMGSTPAPQPPHIPPKFDTGAKPRWKDVVDLTEDEPVQKTKNEGWRPLEEPKDKEEDDVEKLANKLGISSKLVNALRVISQEDKKEMERERERKEREQKEKERKAREEKERKEKERKERERKERQEKERLEREKYERRKRAEREEKERKRKLEAAKEQERVAMEKPKRMAESRFNQNVGMPVVVGYTEYPSQPQMTNANPYAPKPPQGHIAAAGSYGQNWTQAPMATPGYGAMSTVPMGQPVPALAPYQNMQPPSQPMVQSQIAWQPTTQDTVYFRNLPFSFNEAKLRTIMEVFGPLNYIDYPRDPQGNALGYAYVKFNGPNSVHCCQRCIQTWNGQNLEGSIVEVGLY